jgi:hypothetical protein
MRWLRKQRAQGSPQLDNTFQHAADSFVKMTGQLGIEFDYSRDSVGKLEDFIDALVSSGDPITEPLLVVIGAYFGEVGRRAHGGSWQADDEVNGVVITAGGTELSASRQVRTRIADNTRGSLIRAMGALEG